MSHISKQTSIYLRSFRVVLVGSESSWLRINLQNLYWSGIFINILCFVICTFFVFNIDFTANAFSLNTCTFHTQDSHRFSLPLKFKSGKRNEKLFDDFNNLQLKCMEIKYSITTFFINYYSY